MNKLIKHILWISLMVISCSTDPVIPVDSGNKPELGAINFSFIYKITGLPDRRIKRLSLRLAYSEDSLNHGQFFTSTNVSDVITRYQIEVPEGTYYYQATIMCLCAGDSCKYSGFGGQYGTRAVGNKVEVLNNQVTEVTTQFQ